MKIKMLISRIRAATSGYLDNPDSLLAFSIAKNMHRFLNLKQSRGTLIGSQQTIRERPLSTSLFTGTGRECTWGSGQIHLAVGRVHTESGCGSFGERIGNFVKRGSGSGPSENRVFRIRHIRMA
jgi:hypothetical protein